MRSDVTLAAESSCEIALLALKARELEASRESAVLARRWMGAGASPGSTAAFSGMFSEMLMLSSSEEENANELAQRFNLFNVITCAMYHVSVLVRALHS